VPRTINIKESAYQALKVRKRSVESYSDVILRITGSEGSEEKSVVDFLRALERALDPAVRTEIAESVKAAKADLDRVKS
jgi:predicted CopG family antitoxin